MYSFYHSKTFQGESQSHTALKHSRSLTHVRIFNKYLAHSREHMLSLSVVLTHILTYTQIHYQPTGRSIGRIVH